MDGTQVRGTLREMWETRPARPREDRKVAGVAAAIGRRYEVDPVLIRVGFVVAAFSGVGVPLYVAAWLVLPSGPGASRRGLPPPAVLVGLAVVAVLTFLAFFDSASDEVGTGAGLDGGAVLAALVALGLLVLLHRTRGGRAAVPAPAPAPDEPTVSLRKEGAPAWDPLGAAPFAWDLPEPAPAPVPPPVRPAPVTAVTLALALLAGGVTAAALLLAGALTPAAVPVLLGVVLAVLGGGLVVGSFLHAGGGLVPVAVLVGALTWAAVAAPLDDWPAGGVGEHRVAPATVAALAPHYEQSAGEFELDLRDLDLTAAGTPVPTSVSLGAGEIRVLVPADTDVLFTGSVGVGRVAFGDRESNGPGAELLGLRDLGADGVASGRLLEITAEAGAGNVEVLRG